MANEEARPVQPDAVAQKLNTGRGGGGGSSGMPFSPLQQAVATKAATGSGAAVAAVARAGVSVDALFAQNDGGQPYVPPDGSRLTASRAIRADVSGIQQPGAAASMAAGGSGAKSREYVTAPQLTGLKVSPNAKGPIIGAPVAAKLDGLTGSVYIAEDGFVVRMPNRTNQQVNKGEFLDDAGAICLCTQQGAPIRPATVEELALFHGARAGRRV